MLHLDFFRLQNIAWSSKKFDHVFGSCASPVSLLDRYILADLTRCHRLQRCGLLLWNPTDFKVLCLGHLPYGDSTLDKSALLILFHTISGPCRLGYPGLDHENRCQYIYKKKGLRITDRKFVNGRVRKNVIFSDFDVRGIYLCSTCCLSGVIDKMSNHGNLHWNMCRYILTFRPDGVLSNLKYRSVCVCGAFGGGLQFNLPLHTT